MSYLTRFMHTLMSPLIRVVLYSFVVGAVLPNVGTLCVSPDPFRQFAGLLLIIGSNYLAWDTGVTVASLEAKMRADAEGRFKFEQIIVNQPEFRAMIERLTKTKEKHDT